MIFQMQPSRNPLKGSILLKNVRRNDALEHLEQGAGLAGGHRVMLDERFSYTLEKLAESPVNRRRFTFLVGHSFQITC